ncbi:SMEK domain-containing protein [Mucilaginibacter sp. cycad4]|uniref:SMEK domain-containing protein n=1 Tax=Mucilaginibacter sp. cycad4 TaxID=3342096 RepID=UPI002AAB318E|nr:SMEK domain-containing protein [Mucilaginibacter gossypii]WPU99191.1 SMEK domain-containing protein [Mucilaginibacter gossypii]
MSNHNKLLVSIRDYLSRFQVQVKIATANSEYDINQHAENIIIPILNIAFEARFRNTNETDRKNAESIDLVDDQLRKIGIQVTATNSLEKVKTTLNKFLKSGYSKRVDRVLIYILTEKQRSYSQSSIDSVTKGKIKFDVNSQILDASDLYALIKHLNDVRKFQKINELLELQFSDLKIDNDFNYSDYESFRLSYKDKCFNNFSRLNFFGLSVTKQRPREVELYELFVPPLFDFGLNWKNSNSGIIEMALTFPDLSLAKALNVNMLKQAFADNASRRIKGVFPLNDFQYKGSFGGEFEYLFNHGQRLVILGNPGAGKSSIIKYAICKILENDERVFENNDIYRYLPFRIELHKYNQAKVAHGLSFAAFLVNTLASEYQTDISLERIIRILSFFPCLIFFDGIDEIFDVQDRINVRNDIENFTATYPDAFVIVTSRYESYEEVSFNNFYELEVKNFNQEQLEDYVGKWYALEEKDFQRRRSEIAGCVAQLAYVDNELKFNPLLLSLILILYRNELELPTNKLSIYEGCTNTIVDHRDEKEKKLKFNLQIHNKTSVFSSIAYWQFDNPTKRINNTVVQKHIKQYLMKNGEIEDESEAEKAAVEFLDFAKIRSIYFENKFTHKTFLEYFTAYYIFSKFYIGQNQRRFNDILDKNIGLSSWAVVLELLICKIDSNLIESRAMGKIIDTQLQKNKNDALLFFLQILKYLTNINEKITFNLIVSAIKSCFTTEFPLKESKINHKEVLFGQLANIFRISRFSKTFIKAFDSIAQSGELTISQLTNFAYEISNPTRNGGLIKIINTNHTIVESPELFIIRNFINIDSPEKYLDLLRFFVSRFGTENLDKLYKSAFGQRLFFGGDSFSWITSFIISTPPENCYNQYQKLKSIGLSHATIRRGINHKMLTASIIEPYSNLLKGLSQSGFRDFILAWVKPFRNKQHSGKEKFYDVFYQKHK